jgi:hypothetical protein
MKIELITAEYFIVTERGLAHDKGKAFSDNKFAAY